MKSTQFKQLLIPGLAFLFTDLFYDEYLGLNIVIFEAVLLGLLFFFRKIDIQNRSMTTILFFGTVISGFAIISTHSYFSIFVNVISYFALMGSIAAPQLQSMIHILRQGFNNFFSSIKQYLDSIGGYKSTGKRKKIRRWFSVIIFPLVVLGIFSGIYANASPYFETVMSSIQGFLGNWISNFFMHFNFSMIILFFIGFMIASFSFYHNRKQSIIDSDSRFGSELKRKKIRYIQGRSIMGLKKEYQSGIVLLGMLNFLLFIVNTLDIYWVWFRFSKNDHYLKQFVHEGTYLLILSIIISVGLVLYLFSANLNFYKKNRPLKILAYVWLAQNALLAISIGVRNYRYIQYFGIAHKRIGLIFFLILTLIGLWLVYVKVDKVKTYTFIERKFSLNVYIALIVLSLLNWDNFIAKYNMSHYETAILDLSFMRRLNDHALPYLDIPEGQRNLILESQLRLVDNDEYFTRHYDEYLHYIDIRKNRFLEKYPEKNWLGWNWTESDAFQMLSK